MDFWKIIRRNVDQVIGQYRKDGKNIPNRITELRLLMSFVVCILLCFSFGNEILQWISLIVFLIVVLTDKLDGYLARKLNQITDFGKALDPTVDKVLMLAVLIPILFLYKDFRWLIVSIIICEITVGIISSIKRNPVNWLGKLRMVLQSLAVSFLLIPIDGLVYFKQVF